MNTSALKSFAPAVRKQLIEAVTRKLDQALTARTPDYLDTYAAQVRALRELAAVDRKGLIERVAYTWFNRFAALRYLDAKGWHPFHARVLTAAGPEETLPELLKVMRAGALPGELRRYTDVARLESLLVGRIPSADPQAEVYRHLVLAACRFYHGLLPDVFERLDDETELLLPDDLLTAQSVAEGFRTEITEADCEQVEVLGWLYQFYISEKKAEIMARKGAVPSEDIPARTQLFTPHWIVRYLVENSLGRLWLFNRPESLLKAGMPYYIESAKPETEFVRIAGPQAIRLCDPAAGSGHMLTYAFDLLYAIYEEEGYAPSEIPALILRHNLTGIEIDARAAQLAALALTLKAREKSPRFFQQHHFVRPNIVELRDIHFQEGELLGYSEALGLGGLFMAPLLQLMHQFEEAKNFGSLIQPCLCDADIAFAQGSVEAQDLGSNLFLSESHKKVLRALMQASALALTYHVVVANPPYLGGRQMNASLKRFLADNYPDSTADLFAAFIERGIKLAMNAAISAMVTMESWMFLPSYAVLRHQVLRATTILSMVHMPYLGRGGTSMGINFGTVATILANICLSKWSGHFQCVRYYECDEAGVPLQFPTVNDRLMTTRNDAFGRIPGSPIAYWVSERTRQIFEIGTPLRSLAEPRQGMATSDNGRFLRFFYEVSISKISVTCKNVNEARDSQKKWFPYSKGGESRKWFGNHDLVVNWEYDGRELIEYAASLYGSPSRTIKNVQYYFREALTWSLTSSTGFAARYRPSGFIFDVNGMSSFGNDLTKILGAVNSLVGRHLLGIINPTMAFQVGDIKAFPCLDFSSVQCEPLVDECIFLAERDWDSFETSWGFAVSPLLGQGLRGTSLSVSWGNWKKQTEVARKRLQELEVECNRLFIDAYGLQDELTPEVSDTEINLTRSDSRRDVAAFLSYAVGCMMGRYSLDCPGLIMANAGEGLVAYLAKVRVAIDDLAFVPDRDGIILFLDDEWFADDIVARTREFLRVTFGEATLRENIRFIEDSLGRDLRSYFLTDFYKDHLQTYKKRPIYWMVQSPRKGFSVLIYLHRYTRDTMNIILNRYLREFQVKLRSKIEHLQQLGTSASAGNREKAVAAKELTKLTKTLHECEEWERQTILPLAQARVELDLDDGVKVNYLKLGEALAPIPGLAAAEE